MNTLETPVKWAARISGVREVTLHCAADLAYWSHQLKPFGLAPTDENGQACIVIMAASARFKGVPFREVSFSVQVNQPSKLGSGKSVFLLGAFNSSRLFAWIERSVFHTPYSGARIDVECAPDPLFRAVSGRETILAKLSKPRSCRDESVTSEEGWEGRVLFESGLELPGELACFHAEVTGDAWLRDFDPVVDRFSISGAVAGSFLYHLEQSALRPNRWMVRESARHAKSKTYSCPL